MIVREEILDLIIQNIETEHICLRPKTLLLEEGRIATRLFIILKGCLRLFYFSDGKDMSFQFFFENEMVGSSDSIYKQTPSLFSLESIEPSEVLAIERVDFKNLIETNLRFRILCEEQLIERFFTYQRLFLSRIKNTPQQRYEELLRQHPDIIQRVPQHYIASYLGITPVSLSRIRNRK